MVRRCLLVLALVAAAGCETTPQARDAALVSQTRGPGVFAVAEADNWPDRIHIPLREIGDHSGVRTQINGQDVGWFMIDTGSTLPVIDIGDAARLELPVIGRGNTLGVGGVQAYQFRGVREQMIGPVLTEADRVIAINLRQIKPGGFTGLIGFTDFGDAPFTLDQKKGELTVYNPETFVPPTEGKAFRYELFGKLPVMKADLLGGGEVWLILDTGANNPLTLPAEVLTRWPRVASVGASGYGLTTGVGGSVQSRQTWLRELSVMGVALQSVPTSFEEPPAAMRRPNVLIGRIGNGLLKHFRLTFDRRSQTVWAHWQPGE